ncbi:AMP-binding protein [Rhodococcus erythropolis]|uniref:AMP-binding protein n=1 Tax=Rhodococcus erythropolis TaxID=1833 RepID=UPI00380BD9B9
MTGGKLPTIDERRSRLEERFSTWTPMTLDQRLDACADEYPNRPLVITDEQTITYTEARDWAWRLADGLAALGVRQGDHVGIVMANFLEFLPVKVAIARAGAVAVPLNFLYRKDELREVLHQSEVSVLITMTGFAGLNYLEMLDDIAPSWDKRPNVEGADLPRLRRVVLLPTDGGHRQGVLTLNDVASLGEEHPDAASFPGPRDPNSVSDMVFTSGTTGSPKGVLLSHDGPQRTAYSSALTRAYEDGRRILLSLPCYHMFGYIEGILAAMMVGGAVIPQTSFDAANYLAGIERHKATDVLCVPTMTIALLEHPDITIRDLSSLFAVLSGAAPAPVWLWERVRDKLGITEITTGYGMTELGGSMAMTRPEDPLEMPSTTAGRIKDAGAAGLAHRAGALAEHRIVDPQTGSVLPAGAEGEIQWRSPTTMKSFWRKPDETAAAMTDGWIRSGDLGTIRTDGYLQLTGRTKELYKSGGELVMPTEVEAIVSGHPAVSQAYAVGVPDERWGESGCVWIVPASDTPVTAEEIISLCKEKLARFKVPKHVLFTDADSLPTTPTGKVQKFRLAAQAAELLRSV